MHANSAEKQIEFQQEYEAFLHAIYWDEKPLVIFGGGYNASQLITNFFPTGDVEFVVDNDTEKQGSKLCGLNVLSPKELADKPDDYAVLIGTTIYQYEIFEQLHTMNVKTICRIDALILNCTKHISIDRFALTITSFTDSLSRIRRSMSLLKANQAEIKAVRNYLCDSHSVEVYDACVKNRKYNYELWYDIWEQDECQYFSSEIFEYGDNEIFVDGGCFNGHDTYEFIKRVKGNFRKCLMFEPDPTSFSYIRQKTANTQFCNQLEIYQAGLSNESKQAKFFAKGNGCSAVNDNGETAIQLVSLDDIAKDDKITFIKMDIEGEEMNALRGAKGIISRDKPKLAICIYHRLSDYWEVPMFIKQLVPEYRLFVRHHYYARNETVLYATL